MLARLELSEAHATWLEKERRIPSEIAASLGVRSSGETLVFEYPTFRKYRTMQKRFWIEPKGAELRLWNEACLSEACRPETPLIICEGELDVCSWLSAGASHVVSVPNGAAGRPGEGDIIPVEDGQFAYLWQDGKLRPDLKHWRKIILATDGDRPGLILRDELAIRIGRTRCWYVTYPAGCKDANDVLVQHGAEALARVLAHAKPIVPNRLVPFSDIPVSGGQLTYSSGWDGLDKHLILVPPELVVITGTPGAGKSQWALAWVANLARLHGLKGSILQFEDQPDRNRFDLLAYARAWQHQDRGIAEEPDRWLDRMFKVIAPAESDEDEDFNLAWLRMAIEEAATRHGCKWVLIDPWNEVEHVWRISETETGYTNAALRELKRLTRRFQIVIIIVAHPTKGGGQKAGSDISLYDVSGSNAWANKADHGIVVYRESKTAIETFVKIDKSKNHRLMGTPGTVRMEFSPREGTFHFRGEA